MLLQSSCSDDGKEALAPVEVRSHKDGGDDDLTPDDEATKSA
jgi:hypothetical protein